MRGRFYRSLTSHTFVTMCFIVAETSCMLCNNADRSLMSQTFAARCLIVVETSCMLCNKVERHGCVVIGGGSIAPFTLAHEQFADGFALRSFCLASDFAHRVRSRAHVFRVSNSRERLCALCGYAALVRSIRLSRRRAESRLNTAQRRGHDSRSCRSSSMLGMSRAS